MPKLQILAAVVLLGLLAGSVVSSKPWPAAHRRAASACPLRRDSIRPSAPEQVDAATPVEVTNQPADGLEETLASLTSIAQAPPVDDEPLIGALVSLTRRLLQGDLALARAIVAEIDRPALTPQVRNLCIVLLAFTEEPRACDALRAKALSADEDAATLAVEALVGFRHLDKDSPDEDLRRSWQFSFFAHASLLAPGYFDRHDWDNYCRRFISLAPPAEGEEGGAAIEEGPSLDTRHREALVAVARHGASMNARTIAIGRLANDSESVDLLRAIAREDATPDCVKAAVYKDLCVRADDFDFLEKDLQRSKDPWFLAMLCAPLVRSAGPREGEAVALLEALVPLAGANATLGEAMISAFMATSSAHVLQTVERVARSAESDTFRRQAVSALYRDQDGGPSAEERLAVLERLSWAPSAELAAEGALGLLIWARWDPEVASSVIDAALLQRAAALTLMPVVPEQVRGELTKELARWKRAVR